VLLGGAFAVDGGQVVDARLGRVVRRPGSVSAVGVRTSVG